AAKIIAGTARSMGIEVN
ncbi:hypothetical protein, partial [Pseudomonas syringae group genomosp. 7]